MALFSQPTHTNIELPAVSGPKFEPGWVWLCGAGPGDPGLMTIHGLHALKQADVIVYDALVDLEILDWAPLADYIYAGKRGGKASPKQRDISMRLVSLAKEGKRVLRLKGGDPFVFGRGGEEAQTLIKNNIPIRIIPGITAGIAGLAYAGIPVTHREINQSVTFITGHDQSGNSPDAVNWQAVSDGANTLVIYMGIKHIAHIAEQLMAAGRGPNEPVAVVSNATLGEQTVLETTLATAQHDIEKNGIVAPAIICVGQAVLMRQVLDWKSWMNGESPRDLDPLNSKTEMNSLSA